MSTGVRACPFCSTRVLETFWTLVKVRAGEPVKRPALGVGHRKDEQVLLVLFERDDLRKSIDRRLASQGPRPRVPGHGW